MSRSLFVGVDGAPEGWIAVRYGPSEYLDVRSYEAAASVWSDNDDAATVLFDVPIGLSEDRAARDPEVAARKRLGDRRNSVFNVPIRGVLDVEDYEEANEKQRSAIGKGLQKQTHNILPKIREVDGLLARDGPPDQDTVRESHPELCFWALNRRSPMVFSKTRRPAAAFWERVSVLQTVDENFDGALHAAGSAITDWDAPTCSNDDLLDAFALAMTASELTGPLQPLPSDPERDGTGLRMEMVYAEPW